MANPDFFLPSVWSLDSANVQAVESSKTDPKVRLDETGVFVTDQSGNRQVQMDKNGLKIIVPESHAKNIRPPGSPNEELQFVRDTDFQRFGRMWVTKSLVAGIQDDRAVHLSAVNDPDGLTAELWLSTSTNPNTPTHSAIVQAFAEHLGTSGSALTIVDESGRSHFPQMRSPARIRIDGGIITNTGAINLATDGVFSAGHSSLGVFPVNFDPAFATSLRFCVCAPVLGFGCAGVAWNNSSTTQSQFFTFNTAGAAIDSWFSFLAIQIMP